MNSYFQIFQSHERVSTWLPLLASQVFQVIPVKDYDLSNVGMAARHVLKSRNSFIFVFQQCAVVLVNAVHDFRAHRRRKQALARD